MTFTKTLFGALTLCALTLCSLSILASAQTTGQSVQRTSTVGHATLDLATGVLTRGSNDEKDVALAPTFSNTDTSGFFGQGTLVSSAGGPQVWLDWGIVTTDTGSDIIGEFDFGYGTLINDVTNGGPGASFSVAFYDGTTGFCADSGGVASGIPTASFSFTGLPGVTASGINTWVITADLRGGFEFFSAGAGGAFGYSVTTTDSIGTGLWGTGPILCYAGDGLGGPDSNGQVDAFDLYDTSVQSGICTGTFFFGGPPSDFASWYLEVRTAAPDPAGSDDAAAIQFNGSGVNPNNYVVLAPPVLGGTFVATDLSTSQGLGVLLVAFASPLVFPTQFGELLVNVADPGGELFGPAGVSGPYLFAAGGAATISFPVPPNLDLTGGPCISSQTLEFGGGVSLHNGNMLIFGF